jgi:hypothetical protein
MTTAKKTTKKRTKNKIIPETPVKKIPEITKEETPEEIIEEAEELLGYRWKNTFNKVIEKTLKNNNIHWFNNNLIESWKNIYLHRRKEEIITKLEKGSIFGKIFSKIADLYIDHEWCPVWLRDIEDLEIPVEALKIALELFDREGLDFDIYIEQIMSSVSFYHRKPKNLTPLDNKYFILSIRHKLDDDVVYYLAIWKDQGHLSPVLIPKIDDDLSIEDLDDNQQLEDRLLK